VTIAEHVHDVPSDDELAAMIGAATPHFALQIRDRVRDVMAALPPDHPRQAGLRAEVERLEQLAFYGEAGRPSQRDLPPRPSVVPEPGEVAAGAAAETPADS
jgi:hypothetical protein